MAIRPVNREALLDHEALARLGLGERRDDAMGEPGSLRPAFAHITVQADTLTKTAHAYVVYCGFASLLVRLPPSTAAASEFMVKSGERPSSFRQWDEREIASYSQGNRCAHAFCCHHAQ